MRLAIVVNSFPSISETFNFNKVIGLLEYGVDITVFVNSRRNDSALFPVDLTSKVLPRVRYLIPAYPHLGKVLYVFFILLVHPISTVQLLDCSLKQYSSLRRAIKAFLMALPLAIDGYDLIHFEFSGIAVTYQDALSLLQPAKILTSCRGAAEQITPIIDNSRVESLQQVFKHIDSVHCVSQDILRTIEKYGLDSGKAFINRPAIDPEQFHRSSPYPARTNGSFHIISVSRLHWKKGLEFGLMAIKLLLDNRYEVHYDILGKGPEEERLKFMIHDLGLTGYVNLLGRLSPARVKESLESADIFLLPSLSEGISNSLLEAMAMELPVVSTDVGGMDEVIIDGLNGFLVPPYHPDIMAERIADLLNNPGVCLQMGKAGRRRVEQDFSLENQLASFLDEYKRLVGNIN